MKTSRKDGILVLKTESPYKIAINGKTEEKNTIICHDINYATEEIAFELEQNLMTALMDASERSKKQTADRLQIESNMQEENEKNNLFFKNESPSDNEVAQMASSLMLPILMSKNVRLKEVMKTFEALALSGLVKCEGNINMTQPIWEKVKRTDKLKIAFGYMAFFVNPLQQLLTMYAETEKSSAS